MSGCDAKRRPEGDRNIGVGITLCTLTAATASATAQDARTAVRDEAENLTKRGWTEVKAGRYAEATTLLEKALAIREKELGAEHPATIKSLTALADVYSVQGKSWEAVSLYERAATICEKTYLCMSGRRRSVKRRTGRNIPPRRRF